MTNLFFEDANRTLARLLAHIEKLLVQKTPLGFACPVLTAGNIYQAAMVWATSGQHNRARVLLQIGNMFKLQSISQWWGYVRFPRSHVPAFAAVIKNHWSSSDDELSLLYTESLKAKGLPPASKRFETAMQADYSISLAALAHKLNVPPLSEVKAASEARRRNIEIHSICSYADDPTSNTGVTSELPKMAPRNHQSYADHFGYRYVLHSDLAEGRENMEAHYSKMMVVLRALETSPTIEWLMFIDCDAFFTDFTTSLDALVDTFAPEGSGDQNPVGFSALLNQFEFLFPARELRLLVERCAVVPAPRCRDFRDVCEQESRGSGWAPRREAGGCQKIRRRTKLASAARVSDTD
ncbi:hypothetical protein FOZ62_025297 [Perkinsus olseni]|uniref:Uncharacterized protein n=3 Tax=Perkinsus olseni TaxID=32597 RepID=A0A7J6UBV3_PEROL|nr:hypothetical protein FOZ62_025297 [Perkinsus olseni]